MNLGTVAAIRSGLVLSRKLSREISSYRYPLLNLRAIHPDGYILPDSLEVFYATEPLRQDYLTQQGDIIIRLSIPYTAILIDANIAGMVVSSNFAIIRLNQDYILPEYLIWLLNTADIKKKIYESSSSNMLSAVRPTFFADLEILPLPLVDQEKIAKLNLLAKQETQLLKKLADEKERYYAAVIDHVQKNMRRKTYIKQYDGDLRRVERAMSRERFAMDEQSTFDYLYANRNDAEIGQKINVPLNHIEEHNSGKLRNVFRAIDFNSQVDFGEPKEKNATLRNLLEDFRVLDLRPSQLGSADIIGNAYEYMIAMFASDAGKKGGEFFTPSQVSELMAALVRPKENDRIYDPTCGSGGLLLKAYKKVSGGKAAIYGQEMNQQTWALCTMNMFLHSVDDARIWQGDTLSNPQNIENDGLMKFQVVVANPPFSLDKWDSGFLSEAEADSKGKKKMSAELDPYHRFDWGVPPASKGDYAFVLHMLSSLDAENGRMAVVLPHGVLFRGASEGKIRRQLVEMNLLDAVIGLPANLFYGTGIPACILVFKKNRPRRDVLFIDASGDGNFEKGKNQNILRDCDIDRIVSTYETRETVDKYSHVASFDEIRENDFNLNIPRYVDTFEEEELVDIDEAKQNIANIEAELIQVQAQMAEYLEELEL